MPDPAPRPDLLERAELLAFLRGRKLCVEASVAPAGGPQAAVVGYGVGDDLALVFDTLASTRKHENLRADPRIALVVWDDAVTVQLEGTAEFPEGEALERARAIYFAAYPDGRDRLAWPGLVHVVVRPRWARLSDFGVDPPRVAEATF